jgi:Meiotically up-regulated gene 113
MDRQTIIDTIRRSAAENGGVALGQNRFESVSGITQGMWRGKYWLRWSDVVAEAGLVAGRMTEAHAEETLLSRLAELALSVGHVPTHAEVKMARVQDPSFPNHGVFGRLGDKVQRTERLRTFCLNRPELSAVVNLLPPEPHEPVAKPGAASVGVADGDGFVYMMKLGKHYKIGRTFAVPRRHREIALGLPQRPDLVHKIATDDPGGIEAYWHRRFQAKQTNGEWFALGADDVKVFRRRKFM